MLNAILRKISAMLITLVISHQASAQYFTVDASFLTIGNDSIEMKFQKWDGELYSLVDKARNIDYIKTKNTNWTLFNFRTNDYGITETLGGWVGNGFTFDSQTLASSIKLNLHWASFQGSSTVNIAANITIEVPAVGAISDWSIQMVNNQNYPIENIQFPSFYGVDKIAANQADDNIVYPKWGGMLIKDPLNTLRIEQGLAYDNEYPSASNNMQFMGYYNTPANAGLYIACDDTHGSRKMFNINKFSATSLQMYINHTPFYTPNSTVVLPYKVQVGFFTGNWHDAGKKYKASVSNMPWLAKGKLNTRTDIPSWFKKSNYHNWFYTHPAEVPSANPFSMVSQVNTEMANYFGVPGIMDWIGWENVGWYINYPDVFPPKEGWPAFQNALQAVHATGNHVMTISNTNSYSNTAPGFGTAGPYMVKQFNGSNLPPEYYAEGPNSSNLYKMCVGTNFWKTKIGALVDTLQNRSMDGVQIDGFPLTVPVCYEASHGHPVGGADWWNAAVYNIYRSIRNKARLNNFNTILSTEGMAEVYIPEFDSYWNPYSTGLSPCSLGFDNCGNVELIPLWETVYHEYIITQAGISFYTPNSGEEDYYRRGFAMALTWGETPTTFSTNLNYNNNPGSPLLAYLKRIVLARSAHANEFLVYGDMQKKLELSVPNFTIPGANGIPYTGVNYPAFSSPTVLTSSWRSQQGTAGHIFTNISNSARTFSADIKGYEAPGTLYNVIKILNGNYSVLQVAVTLPVTETFSLSTNDVLIIKAIPVGGANNWTGLFSSDWTDPANWASNIVPTIAVDVIIPVGTTYSPVVNAGVNAFCKSIVVQTGANITTKPGGYLKVGQ